MATSPDKPAAPSADPITSEVTLVCAISEPERMDITVRTAAELGVRTFVPVVSQRTTTVPSDAREATAWTSHWRHIVDEVVADEGVETMEVVFPVPLRQTVGLLESSDLALVAWEEQEAGSIREAVSDRRGTAAIERALLVVGPESGLDPSEVGFLASHGAVPITLGKTVLRCETAAIVGCVLLVDALWDAFGGGGRPHDAGCAGATPGAGASPDLGPDGQAPSGTSPYQNVGR